MAHVEMDEKLVSRMLDRLAIEEVLVRYSTCIDTKRFDGLKDVFTADAVVDYVSAGGPRASVPEVSEWLAKVLAPFKVIQHMLGNFSIEVDGDRARSVCYFHNPMGLPGADGNVSMFWCGGRYVDQLVRTSAGWRISERIDEVQYMHGLPAAGKR
jgi:hypothetical protein